MNYQLSFVTDRDGDTRHVPPLRDLRDAVFRANPQYQILPIEQTAFADIPRTLGQYGILCPRTPTLQTKVICAETAKLFRIRKRAGVLPPYIKKIFNWEINKAIALLVLDGVIEMEDGSIFLSGVDAWSALFEGKLIHRPQGELARISIQALKYAQTLKSHGTKGLSQRIYYYHSKPLMPAWERRVPTPDAVLRYLELGKDFSNSRLLSNRWRQVSLPEAYSAWLLWKPVHRVPTVPQQSVFYKLYVSPDPTVVGEVFRATVSVLATADSVLTFKIAKNARGLLRTDKIVVYFPSFEALFEMAASLRSKIDGSLPHGVPFTAECFGNPLLSWGVDPPAELRPFESRERESWRVWISNRLAAAITTGKLARSSSMEPWEFALNRLCLEGIDTNRWVPCEEAWARP
jgi:hypothetical protein